MSVGVTHSGANDTLPGRQPHCPDGTAAPCCSFTFLWPFSPPSPESALCQYQVSDIGVLVAALLSDTGSRAFLMGTVLRTLNT